MKEKLRHGLPYDIATPEDDAVLATCLDLISAQ